MKRITIELPDDVAERLASETIEGEPGLEATLASLALELLRERADALSGRRKAIDDLATSLAPDGSPLPSATEVDEFLKHGWADAIARDSGLGESHR